MITNNGQLVFGTIAGVTNGGYGNAEDAYATTVDLKKTTEAGTLLHATLSQHDYDSRAFSVPPDGRVLASGTGYSFNPTQFTSVLNTNVAANDMTGKAARWATDMHVDKNGNPFMGVVVPDNLTDAVGSNLE